MILDKPLGLSSQQAVTQVKRCYNAKKAGHTGCLDVEASGLLPICLGEATKFSQFLLEADKRYQVTAKLGVSTDTFDAAGEITAENSIQHITAEDINKALQKLTGTLHQLPPMYSALKHKGKPLYELARKGVEVERQIRIVQIYELKLINWQQELIKLSVHCSKGTYIRSLVDDLGKLLECGAHVTELRRLTAGHFQAAQMIELSTLQHLVEEDNKEELRSYLLPIESLLYGLPIVTLSKQQAEQLWQGKELCQIDFARHEVVQLQVPDIGLVGVGELLADGRLRSKRLIAPFATK